MVKNVINTTILNPLDLIAPHSCRGCGRLGSVLCDCCKKYIVNSNFYNKCPKCKRPIMQSSCDGLLINKCSHCKSLPPFYTIGSRDKLLAKLIYDYKYYSTRAIGVKLADLMNDVLPLKNLDKAYIVPLPTSTRHVRERGFDHTLYIARRLARLNKNVSVEPLLERDKNSVQVGSDKKTRLIQARTAYKVRKDARINKDGVYILFDDVWTTGASMLTAVKMLRTLGTKHLMIAELSVSELDD